MEQNFKPVNKLKLQTVVPKELAGKRLDQALATIFPEHSRSRIQTWISTGDVTVNSASIRQRDKVSEGDKIRIETVLNEIERNKPEPITLDILYEDDVLIIINKPAGLVVHPGAGNPNHTLVNALLNYDANLSVVPRAGIIHRLDKDTTGIMVIAKTLESHTFLVDKLQQRKIKREYQTIVTGQITAGGTIQNMMGRNPLNRKKMTVTNNGKLATTHYRLIKKYQHYTHLNVQIESGRTHQIRVHMSHINYPIVGDPVYGKNRSVKKGLNEELRKFILNFKRQALHAYSLELPHPLTGKEKTFKAGLPEDIKGLIKMLDTHDK